MSKIILNKEICEFIGAFIGDGYLGNYGKTKKQYVLGISGNKELDEDYFKNYLIPLLKKNFKCINPRLYYRNDENTIMLRINSKELYDWFMDLGFNSGKKSHTVKIPEKIFNNKKLVKYVIRGIFDTDGCIFFDKRSNYCKPYPRITLQLASMDLINQIEFYLSNHFNLYTNRSSWNGKRSCIEIYGHKQLEKFLKEIGLSNKRHLAKVKMPL